MGLSFSREKHKNVKSLDKEVKNTINASFTAQADTNRMKICCQFEWDMLQCIPWSANFSQNSNLNKSVTVNAQM